MIYVCLECKKANKRASFKIPLVLYDDNSEYDACPYCESKNIKKYD